MKVNFNKKISPIENIQEEPIKRRRWDRWVYLGILIILFVSFLKWLTFPWFFNSAEGILLQHQYDVKLGEDVRILEYKVKEGQTVKPGDTLFTYEQINDDRNNSSAQDSIQIALKDNTNNAALIALDGQIEKRKLFLADLNKRLTYWKSEKARKEKLVYLNVITPNELANVDRSIDDISYEIATTKAEYQVLLKERSRLNSQANETNYLGYKNIGLSQQKEAFKAFTSGKVDRLIIPEKQVAFKDDKITSIIYPEYFVRAYIEMSDLDDFKIGDDVIVSLPYKSNDLAGKVNKVYSVSELKNEIIPNNTINNDGKYGIVVEIVPTNKKDWDGITVSNIPVKVRKGKIKI